MDDNEGDDSKVDEVDDAENRLELVKPAGMNATGSTVGSRVDPENLGRFKLG